MNKKFWLQSLLWVLQGLLVGIGVILPGVSGGSLLYAFGIYDEILEVLSTPIKGIKKYWKMLCFVGIGGAIGFIGFAAAVESLLSWNESVVICVFVGLIIGTLPSLWREAGAQGRGKGSFVSLIISFIAVAALFVAVENFLEVNIPHNTLGWIICGLIWGLGFVVPGLASSNLLMFFGIYNVLLGHIKNIDLGVMIPFGLSVLAVFLLLSKVVKLIFDKYYSIMSHCIIGFVLATTVLILPRTDWSLINVFIRIACIVVGGIASYFFTKFSDKIGGKA